MERYDRHYSWGDADILWEILRRFDNRHLCAVDVACGPNVIVPRTLLKRDAPFTYVAVDIDLHHLDIQRRGIRNDEACSICAASSDLPLKTGSVSLFIFHHAIDDILETQGLAGIELSLKESLRVTTEGGVLAFSHCVFDYDRFTKKISLDDIETILAKSGSFEFEKRRGTQQDWLIVKV